MKTHFLQDGLKPLNQNKMKTVSVYEWYKNKLIKILIKTIKHILALPTYPFFITIWILDFIVGKYINLIKMIIK